MNAEFKAALAAMGNRAKALNVMTAHPGSLTGLDKVFEAALASTGKGMVAKLDGKDVGMAELLTASRNNYPPAVAALQALRMENVDLYCRASSNFGVFYEVVNLKDNEQPCIESTYRNPVRVKYMGEDGSARSVKAVKAKKQVFFNMRQITSDEVGYQIRDLNQGVDIESAAKATVDVAWDITNKVDVEEYNFMVGGTINKIDYGAGLFGNFTRTGTPLSRTFVFHPRINLANIPTKNDYANSDLDDYGTSTDNGLFRPSVIRKIMDHCDAFGNVLGGQPLAPTGVIYLPSSEVNAIARGINPFGNMTTSVGESALDNFTQFVYFKKKVWTLIPDVTLPLGRCHVVLNRKVGNLYVKPQFDEEFVTTDRQKNYESRSATKAISLATIEPWRVGALRIAYNNNPSTLTSNE